MTDDQLFLSKHTMTTEQKPLHIVHLEVSNIKRIKAVEVTPNGNTVVISGQNGAGKSSILDAIEYALAGKDAICERPLRDGTSKGYVVCDLHEIVVRRSFSASGGTNLTVTAKDGAELRSPQAVLDKLCAHVAFDPLSFVRMKPAEQLETLRKLVNLDFTALDAQRKAAYDERTLVNRKAKEAEARLAAFPHKDAPAEEVSVSSLVEELNAIREHNKKNDAVRAELERKLGQLNQWTSALEDCDRDITVLENRLKEARAKRKEVSQKRDAARREAEDFQQKVAAIEDKDERPILDKMNKADETNSAVRSNRRRKELQEEVRQYQAEADRLTREIERIDKEKQDQLANARFPLPNLSFDETGVLLDGVPFSQCSQAEQLRVAVAIGLALNPRIRVILIRDGSLLDENSMNLLRELAEERDAQLWIERVGDGGPGCIVIEDGTIRE